jgi:hypothetical protein
MMVEDIDCRPIDRDLVSAELDTASGARVASAQRLEVAAMDDRIIHSTFPKSSHSTPRSRSSAAALVILLSALMLLALLLPSFGRVGVDSPDQPLRPPAGFGL